MKNIRWHRPAALSALYAVFTTGCGILGGVFPESARVLFWFWYQVSAAIWMVLAIAAAVLLIRLLRVGNREKKRNHRKE